MVEENARVIAVDGDFALVETQRKAVCDVCSVNKGCGTAVLSKVLGNRRIQLQTLNKVSAKIGDEVVIGFEDKMLVKYSLIVYAVPILLLLFGAWLGEYMSGMFGWQSSEALSIIIGVVGMVGGFIFIRFYSNRVSHDDRYQPTILRDKTASYNQDVVQSVNWVNE